MEEPSQDSVSSTHSISSPQRSKITEDGVPSRLRKPPVRAIELEPLLTAEDVARRLNVSTDWVWDHSSRKKPLLPVIRMGDGALRYRASGIEAFIDERERLSTLRRRA
jgi:predicted DNA-binding transcriptional regulator AlpA